MKRLKGRNVMMLRQLVRNVELIKPTTRKEINDAVVQLSEGLNTSS